MGNIKIKSVSNTDNTIKVDYEVSKDIEKYFNIENKFKIEYKSDISKVPEEIAVIPFITNVIPIIWLTDSTLEVEKADKVFIESLEKVKKGFINMYPNAEFQGKIKVKELIVTSKINEKKRSSIFFSGGVDSTSSLIAIEDKKPILITIWGSDIWDYDELGWKEAKETVRRFGKEFNLENIFLKSNFRKFIKEQVLTEDFKGKLNDSWWHGIQHGIGLLGHVAPYSYQYNIVEHYIPATYTKEDINITCASYPTIDEALEFANCKIIHEGFDKTRQKKIENICNYAENSNKDIKLRVCYMERGTKLNCCHCEKCYRTIFAILSEKQNPEKFGFEIEENTLKRIEKEIKENNLITNSTKKMWREIQDNFKKDKKYWKKQKDIKWILKYKLEHKGIREKLKICKMEKKV